MNRTYLPFSILLLVIFLLTSASPGYTQHWVQQQSGLGVQLHDVHFVDENIGYVVGRGKTVLKTTDGGKNWFSLTVPFGPSTTAFYAVFFIDKNRGWIAGITNPIYGGGGEEFIVRTTDGGNSWIDDQSLPNGSRSGRTVNDIQFINNNIGWLIVSSDIYKTINSGNTWNIVCSDCAGEFVFWDIHFVDASNGWVVTIDNNFFRTVDGGNNWFPLPEQETSVGSRIHFINAQTGWYITAGPDFTGKIGKTTDGGNTWNVSAISQSLLGFGDGDIEFIDGNYGWIAGNSDILHTTDGGATWVVQNDSIGQGEIDFVSRTKGWMANTSGEIWHFECSIPPTTIDTVICPGESLQVANVDHTQSGHYEYLLEGTYGCDSMIVLDLEVLPDQATAGTDLTVCTTEAQLQAQAPSFPLVTGAWSALNTSASIGMADNSMTEVQGLQVGENSFIWALSHPSCPEYERDTVTITYPFLPEADAGGDLTVCRAEAQLDALPNPAPLTGRWTIDLTGPEFSDPTDPFSTVSKLIPGREHQLTWTLSHPDCPDYSSSSALLYYEDGPIEAADDRYYYTSDTLRVNITNNDQFPDPSAIVVTIEENRNNNIGHLDLDALGNLTFYLTEPSNVYSRSFRYRIAHADCPYIYAEAEVTLDFTNSPDEPVKQEISLVFTPDGDGINDTFIIPELLENPEDYPGNSLVVINRWGEVVYEAKPYLNDWDGTHYKTGEILPVGTYFFIARLHLADGIVQEGKATLVR